MSQNTHRAGGSGQAGQPWPDHFITASAGPDTYTNRPKVFQQQEFLFQTQYASCSVLKAV